MEQLQKNKSDININTQDDFNFVLFKKGQEVSFEIKKGTYVFNIDSYEGLILYKVISFKEGDKIIFTLKPIIGHWYDFEKDGTPKIVTKSLEEIERGYKIANNVDLDSYKDLADKVISGEVSISSINELNSFNSISDSTELITLKNEDYYKTMLDKVREINNKVDIVKGLILTKVNNIKNEIGNIVDGLEKTIKKLNKIVFTLSIYAGINEDVIQVSEGVPANIDEPIYLQQNMLFMDEEVGDPENGGISYDSVQKFYDWLTTYNNYLGYKNYNLILPYQKCVALMRVRRKPSEIYQRDIWGNRYEVMKEMKTCMLIRNGENIYVIHSDMHFSEKLFPQQEEFKHYMDVINGIDEKRENKYGRGFGSYINSDEAKEVIEEYRNGMVLIQGIFDRTDLLAPIGTINILSGQDLNNGKIIFNYGLNHIEDNDKSKTFFRWIGNHSNVKEGSQILFNGFGGGYRTKDRVVKYYASDYSVPSPPEKGIYLVEKYEQRLSILYLPDEEVYDKRGVSSKRKKRERVIINPDCDAIINIDDFSHRDYEYIRDLMYDRKHRKNYLWLVPLMQDLKEYVETVNNDEIPFIQLLQKEFPTLSQETLLDYLFWWKTKNKWKRSLSTDDKKAYRMIMSKLKNDVKNDTLLTYESFF